MSFDFDWLFNFFRYANGYSSVCVPLEYGPETFIVLADMSFVGFVDRHVYNIIFWFCWYVGFMLIFIILLAVYKESWWNLAGFKKYLLVIISIISSIFIFLIYIRQCLFCINKGLFPPETAQRVLGRSAKNVYEYTHFLISPSIVEIQLFILFVFICILISMYYQAIDDFSINFGTPIVMLFCVLGCCLLIMVRDFFVLYLFLELQSLALYVLVCIRKIRILVVRLV